MPEELFAEKQKKGEKKDDAKRPSTCNQMAWYTRCLFTKHSPWWSNGWNTSIKRSPSKDKIKWSPGL
jgi:hypothetical protein